MSNFYSRSQEAREAKETFTDDLHVLARKIIAHKPSFHLEANQQLKAKYVHKLQDPYYVAMVHSAMQSFPEKETFTRFQGHLDTMLGGHRRQSKSSATSLGINVKVGKIRGLEAKLSKNSRQ